jgi:transposase
MTHDYLRHGVTTLFAAFDVLEGTVLGRCMQRHRHQEFLRFLNTIEGAVPAGKVIHVILDNYGSHKHPKVLRWLARHPRFIFHFTPTSGSWLNAVETFFSALTRRRIRRGSFRSIVDLQAAINRYIDEHNDAPKPFTWTKTPVQILAKLNPLNAPVHSAPLRMLGPSFLNRLQLGLAECPDAESHLHAGSYVKEGRYACLEPRKGRAGSLGSGADSQGPTEAQAEAPGLTRT